jgi:hypothetical protein
MFAPPLIDSIPAPVSIPAGDSDCEETSTAPSTKAKVYRCLRDPNCQSTFDRSSSVRRHEKTCHPLPADFKCCVVCNRSILIHKYKAHVSSCVSAAAPVTPIGLPSLPSLPVPVPVTVQSSPASVTLAPVLPSSASTSSATLLSEADMDIAMDGFLVWSGSYSTTPYAASVKHSRVDTPKKQSDLRREVRLLMRTAHSLMPDLFANGIFMGGLVQPNTVNAIHQYQSTARVRVVMVRQGWVHLPSIRLICY